MTTLLVHSLNVRGSIKSSADLINSKMSSEGSECTAILLQDIGITGPEGPPLLKRAAKEHNLYINQSQTNKSRSVAIIVHKNWQIRKVLRDQGGSLVGVCAERCGYKLLLISAFYRQVLTITERLHPGVQRTNPSRPRFKRKLTLSMLS
jgi:hypothetical protein